MQNHFNYQSDNKSDSGYSNSKFEAKNIVIKVLSIRRYGKGETRIIGEVFHLPVQGNAPDIRKKLPEKEAIDVVTFIPADSIRDTVVFDKLVIQKSPLNAYIYVGKDPRTACQTPGTTQHAEKAYKTLQNMHHRQAPSPCGDCGCHQKKPAPYN